MRLAAALLALLLISPAWAEPPVYIEEMTSQEVGASIKAGRNIAIIYAGSTEQNGPHMVLGKHNFMAHRLAGLIASELGNALVYPVLPFAPTGDPEKHSGHMRYPGSVSLRLGVYGAVIQDVAVSAIASGFRYVLIMGDHGGGQKMLSAVAEALDNGSRPYGIRVFYIGSVYSAMPGGHAGREDTSMLMAIDGGGVREGKLKDAGPWNGADSSPEGASKEEGERLIRERVNAAVSEIRRLIAAH
ncbi:MAG TPA: creatininase family protein [Burkholderiales bacterium]|nr:creatininase family protein [Burkholderiales bacterium]